MLLLRPFFIACVVACWTAGCSLESIEVVSETDEKQYQMAKQYQEEGRTDEALSAFLRVIDARRDSPESHLEAGYIYLREMEDPISSIFHFKRYLQLKPNSNQTNQVKQLIETAEKDFVRQLPAHPYQGHLDRIDMLDLLEGLKRENEKLKRDLVVAQNRMKQLEAMMGEARRSQTMTTEFTRLPPVSAEESPPGPEPTLPEQANVPRTYVVQSGDSLSSISHKFYGTPSRWIDIYQSNRDRMSSENALRVGQELRIP